MGGNVEGVSVMKDEELQREEIEVSHKLGGAGEGRAQGRGNNSSVSHT